MKECKETIRQYKRENKASNLYRKVAENFVRYEEEKVIDDSDDYCFYQYLKSLGKEKEYSFPLKNGSTVIARVDLFHPYEELDNQEKIIKPQWHLLVSSYAYLDAAYNHLDNQVLEKTNWKNKQLIRDWSRNNTMNTWLREARIVK